MLQDITSLFRQAGFKVKKPVKIESNRFSYALKSTALDNWNFHAFYAFRQIQKKRKPLVKTFATIGSGNGVDALGAYFAFPKLENVVMTDINKNVIGLCEKNFSKNAVNKINSMAFEGFLCEPLIKNGINADLIYGNIPNVPDDSGKLFEGRNSSGFLERKHYGNIPKEFEDYYMVSIYALLKSAKKALAKNGTILLNFGGRVPFGLMPKMFKQNGYSFKEISCGFKMQTETMEMLLGYKKGEEQNGINFDFFEYNKSVNLLKKKRVQNPTNKIGGKKLKGMLAPFRLNSAQALKLFRKKQKIGHTVHLLAGNKE